MNINIPTFFLLLIFRACSVVCLDLFRNNWRESDKATSRLLNEIDRLDEEIRTEKLFIMNIERIKKELVEMKSALSSFNTANAEQADLRGLEMIKEELDASYEVEKRKLLQKEAEMEGLWFDDEFRIAFDMALKQSLLTFNPVVMSPLNSDLVKRAIHVKIRLLAAEKVRAVESVNRLKEINECASRIDHLFHKIDFYEASRDHLALFDYNLDTKKIVFEFEKRQKQKNELVIEIREMRTMQRVNTAVDKSGWKMRIYGFTTKKTREPANQNNNLILSPQVLKYSVMNREEAEEDDDENIDIDDVMLIGKYAKYVENIYKYFSDPSIKDPPQTVIEEAIDKTNFM